jgi:hypothetical protein
VKSLIRTFQEQFETDVSNPSDNARILRRYETATSEGKELLDDVFISLCGYSLETLIEMNNKGNEDA